MELESVELSVLRSMAAIYKNKNDYEKSLSYIEKANKLDPNDINIILLESNIRWEMGDVESYEKLITKALEIDPENVDLHFNLGVISSDKGDIDKAMSHYNKAIEIDSTYTKAYLNAAALILQPADAMLEELNLLNETMRTEKEFILYDNLKV